MNNLSEQHDDVVSRLARAAAAVDVPPGPDDAMKQRLVATMQERSNSSAADEVLQPRKVRTMQKLLSAAAVVALILGVWGASVLTTGGHSAAFAAMIDRVATIQSARFNMHCDIASKANETTVLDSKFTLAPPWTRVEATVNGMNVVRIFNNDTHQMLTLFENLNTAQLETTPNDPKALLHGDVIERLHNLRKEGAEFLGKEQSSGIECLKFRQNHRGDTYTIWIDAATELPVHIEMSDPDTTVAVKFSNFEWDIPFDATQLTLDPPAGYKLTESSK